MIYHVPVRKIEVYVVLFLCGLLFNMNIPAYAKYRGEDACNAVAGSPFEPDNLGKSVGVEDVQDIDFGERSACTDAYFDYRPRGQNSNPIPAKLLFHDARISYGRYLWVGSGCGFESQYAEAAELEYFPAQHDLGLMYLNGHCVEADAERSASMFLDAARKGYLPSQHMIGMLLLAGNGVPKDHENAARWLTTASDKGYTKSLFPLGTLHRDGLGVPKNVSKAKKLFEAAAERGSQEALTALVELNPLDESDRQSLIAQTTLGLRHILGEGADRDPNKGLRLIVEAAAAGVAEAQYTLGMIFSHDQSKPNAHTQMVFWVEAAARQNYVPAQTFLGAHLWERALDQNSENRTHYDEARKWLLAAAEQGDPFAQFKLGEFEFRHLHNKKDAIQWYTRSASQGFVPAQSLLGRILFDDGSLSEREYVDAVGWLRPAAEKGDAFALTYLGRAYWQGRGLERNKTEAIRLWKQAAEQGFARAEEHLAYAYREGEGVERNVALAQDYLRRAAKHGSESAQWELDSLTTNKFSNPVAGAALLTGILALMVATAGDGGDPLPRTEMYSDTVGSYMIDLRDPIQFQGTMMMMDIR